MKMAVFWGVALCPVEMCRSFGVIIHIREVPGSISAWDFVVFLSNSRQVQRYYLKIRLRPLPSTSFSIHYSPNIFSFNGSPLRHHKPIYIWDFKFSRRRVWSLRVFSSQVEVNRRFRGAYLHHQGDESAPLKRRSTSTWLHDATSQNTINVNWYLYWWSVVFSLRYGLNFLITTKDELRIRKA
jgi:hypothetical protein